MKLVVEVVGARDLPARRSRGGGVAPFVQVAFGGQRHATGMRPGEANPTWNETVVFVVDAVAGARGRLSDRSIDVGVYHRRSSGGKSCLGRVRLFGAAVAPSAEEAVLLRCPLDKPSFFAPARGEVALRLYLVPYGYGPATPAASPAGNAYSSTYATTFNDSASMAGVETVVGGASTQSSPAMVIQKKKKKREPAQEPMHHVFNSIPTHSMPPPPPPPSTPRPPPPPSTPRPPPPPSTPRPPPPPSTPTPRPPPSMPPPPPPPPSVPPPTGAPKATKKAAPATAEDAKAAEYLMVDKLEFLYVNVVRARGLSGTDLTLGIDPYVEVRVGNYSAVTRHLVRNREPEWDQVFAFSKDQLQADVVEVIVKDKNLIVWDGFVGKADLKILELPSMAPPNRPLAPQWYGLKGAKGQWTGGEVMVAAWKGSQSDEAFGSALHAGAHDLAPAAVVATQTKSYYSPRLCYLRCHVIAAQDLVHPDRSRRSRMSVFVRVQLGAQRWYTRASPSARWDQDFFLVAAWPFEEPLEIAVMDNASPERHELLGQLSIPKGSIKVQQFDKKKFKPPPPSWFDLELPRSSSNGGDGGEAGDARPDGGRRHEFRSKIQLRVYYDAAYHVLDEVTTYASDFLPSARPLRPKAPIGVLELAVLRATGLRSTKKRPNGGPGTVDAYCVARYGQKWIRTRTLLDTASPSWQEQFTFDVFDPCTVLTVAVFDNGQLSGDPSRRGATDTPLGKVRIRVSTLASGRTYEHPYSLFVVHPTGLLRCGELHLAVRFTHTAWVNMMSLYLRPALPNQHFSQPIPTHLVPRLRRYAVDVVASRLARAEPPLLPAAVHYLLRDPAAHPRPDMPEDYAYSMRRTLAAFARLRDVVAPLAAFASWFRGVRDWENPATTVLVLAVFLVLAWMPSLILPTLFLYLFAVGAWNFRGRPARLPQMEHYGDGVPQAMLEEEFDAGPASGTPPEAVQQWYWRLRGAGRSVQVFVGDVASQGERVHALLAWRDRRASVIALVAVAALTVVTYAVPFRALVAGTGLYVMRHPLLRRKKEPSALMSFFRRLPTNDELML